MSQANHPNVEPQAPVPPADTEKTATRVQIIFDEAAMATLDEVKQAYGKRNATTATVIRDALGFYSWAQREINKGNKIGVIGSDDKVKEVVLPFQM